MIDQEAILRTFILLSFMRSSFFFLFFPPQEFRKLIELLQFISSVVSYMCFVLLGDLFSMRDQLGQLFIISLCFEVEDQKDQEQDGEVKSFIEERPGPRDQFERLPLQFQERCEGLTYSSGGDIEVIIVPRLFDDDYTEMREQYLDKEGEDQIDG